MIHRKEVLGIFSIRKINYESYVKKLSPQEKAPWSMRYLTIKCLIDEIVTGIPVTLSLFLGHDR